MTAKINLDNYNSFSGADVLVSAQMVPVNNGDNMKVHILSSLQTISYSTHQDKAPVRSIGNINAKDYVMGQRTIAGTMVFAMFDEHWMTPLLEELNEYTKGTDIWSDELPALNITISMANEYGYKSCMVIYGVKFIDDGGVMSINDLYTENTLQFLAVGIEPLRSGGQYKHSFSNKRNKYTIVKADNSFKWKGSTLESYKKEWQVQPYTPNPGKTPTDNIPGNNATITVEKPITNGGNGIINIYLPEEEKELNIYIKDTSNNEYIPVHKNPISNEYYAPVNEGEYTVIMEDKETQVSNESNIISVKKDSDKVEEVNYPIICDITNSSIKILSNNKEHDSVLIKEYSFIKYDDETDIYYEDPEIYSIKDAINNNKEIELNNLKPNTNYSLYTFNSLNNSRSEDVFFKTFETKDEIFNIFREYVVSNKKLHINEELVNFNFDTLEKNQNNLIDAVLKVEDKKIKTELLLYAVKLQNEITKGTNDTGLKNSIHNLKDEPLEPKFEIDENVKSFNVYMRNNDKNYYVSSSNAHNNYVFTGKNNIRYYTQPLSSNNKKGCFNNFVCYTTDDKKMLSKYKNVGNVDNVSFINYKNTYDFYNIDLKNAIKVKDNFLPYKELLCAPYGYIEDEVLILDINYKEFMQLNNNSFYVCISQIEDVLDHTPIRKIECNNSDTFLQLNKYYTGILKNNYYLIWIEDKDFNMISDSFIISTYENDIDYEKFNLENLKDYLKYYKNIFTEMNASFLEIFNSTYLNFLSQESIGLKDMEYKIIKNMMEYNTYSSYSTQLDEAVYNVVALNCANYENVVNNATLNDSFLSFDNLKNHHLASVTIDLNKENIIKTSYDNFNYDINSKFDGYTILFLLDDYSFNKTGFILINNSTKQIYNYNINLEVK